MRSVLKALKEVPCGERKEVAKYADSVAAVKVLRALLDYRELRTVKKGKVQTALSWR